MTCYNCGVELNDTNKTREHIPAQAFYVGFDVVKNLNKKFFQSSLSENVTLSGFCSFKPLHHFNQKQDNQKSFK